VTANSLSDIKSTTVSYMFPGVEVQATFLNNILDNNFIKKSPLLFDIALAILLAALIGFGVMNFKSPAKSVILFFGVYTAYFIFSILIMHFFNIWINLVAPIMLGIFVFAAGYICVKNICPFYIFI